MRDLLDSPSSYRSTFKPLDMDVAGSLDMRFLSGMGRSAVKALDLLESLIYSNGKQEEGSLRLLMKVSKPVHLILEQKPYSAWVEEIDQLLRTDNNSDGKAIGMVGPEDNQAEDGAQDYQMIWLNLTPRMVLVL